MKHIPQTLPLLCAMDEIGSYSGIQISTLNSMTIRQKKVSVAVTSILNLNISK